MHRFSNCHNLKVNIVVLLLYCGCTSKSIQLCVSDWISQLCEVSLESYTMNCVFLPLVVFACDKCSLATKVWETYSNFNSSTAKIKTSILQMVSLISMFYSKPTPFLDINNTDREMSVCHTTATQKLGILPSLLCLLCPSMVQSRYLKIYNVKLTLKMPRMC